MRLSEGYYRLVEALPGLDKRFRSETLTFRAGLPAHTLLAVEQVTIDRGRGRPAQTELEVRVVLSGDVARHDEIVDRLKLSPVDTVTALEYALGEGYSENEALTFDVMMRAGCEPYFIRNTLVAARTNIGPVLYPLQVLQGDLREGPPPAPSSQQADGTQAVQSTENGPSSAPGKGPNKGGRK